MTIQHAGLQALPFEVSQWRQAYRLAAEAERALSDAGMMHKWGQGPGPTPLQRDATTRLRAAEQSLFARANLEFGAKPAAL